LKWPTFVSPYIRVDCSDGPRFILRKPERAFGIMVTDWDARIKAIIKAFEAVGANMDLEVRKRIRSLAQNLGRNYAELQSHYQAAYLSFVAQPCSEQANDALTRANDEIRRLEFKLREIEIETERVITLAKQGRERYLRIIA
jgi:hypothetical protein